MKSGLFYRHPQRNGIRGVIGQGCPRLRRLEQRGLRPDGTQKLFDKAQTRCYAHAIGLGSAGIPTQGTMANMGHANGLGSRDYGIVEVPPADPEKFQFPYDRRPSRQRFMERFEKFTAFPYDRHDGKGFAREDEVDLEAMKRHYEHATNGHADIQEHILTPADDN